MAVSRKVLHGTCLEFNRPPVPDSAATISLKGIWNNSPSSFTLDDDILQKHSLFIGGTGSGKTTLIYHFMEQLKRSMTDNDVMVIFDSKGDFLSKFYNPNTDSIIGNSHQYRRVSEKWNIFKEVTADGFSDESISQNIQEVCKSLFEERIQKSSSNAFFPNAARDVLAAIMLFFTREVRARHTNIEMLHNESLKSMLDTLTSVDFCAMFDQYPDLNAVRSYIEGEGGQSQGVMAELYSVIRDVFMGIFAADGRFSMREFVRNKGAHTLFIEYDLSIGNILTPIYRLLVDLALKEALGRTAGKGNVYLFCDEFKLLPYLQHIDDAVNFGRSLGVKVFAGLQSITQLYEIYGVHRGQNIAAGFSSTYAFRANDPVTRKYISDLFGGNIVLEQFLTMGNQAFEDKRVGKVVEDWELNSLSVGEAIVGLPFSNPFKFKFANYRK